MSGGFPISACVDKGALIERAWPKSQGEAIHTSTFLGHPVGCAMALANIAEIRVRKLVDKAAEQGNELLQLLSDVRVAGLSLQARGRGLLAGLEVRHASGEPATDLVMRVVKAMLHRGFIVLPEGEHGNVIGFTPPLTITKAQLRQAVRGLEAALEEAA